MGRVPIQVEQFYIEICCIYHFYFYFILSLDISLYLYCCPFLHYTLKDSKKKNPPPPPPKKIPKKKEGTPC